jgi:hypothetical protein
MVDVAGVAKPTPLDDADRAKIGKEIESRYVPPQPPERTLVELIAETKASAAAQAAKDPPDKDTQGQVTPVAGGGSP